MTPSFRVAPAPIRFSTRVHLQALRRSAVVCFLGLAIWIALALSGATQAGAAKPTPPISAPVWTLGAATSFDSIASLRHAAKASACGARRR